MLCQSLRFHETGEGLARQSIYSVNLHLKAMSLIGSAQSLTLARGS